MQRRPPVHCAPAAFFVVVGSDGARLHDTYESGARAPVHGPRFHITAAETAYRPETPRPISTALKPGSPQPITKTLNPCFMRISMSAAPAG